LEEEKTLGRPSEIVRIGGYLVAAGALVGFSLGVYLLFNRDLFSFLIRIAPFEILSYFLGVFIPSFVVLIVIGYLFATTSGLKNADLSNVLPLCVLSLLCMVLSALSVFYFISFLGGFLTLMVSMKAYARPSFRTLSNREAFFMVEMGALFVAASSVLFFSVWLLSNVFSTYPLGFYVSYSPIALLFVGFLSFFMFFVIPLWGSRGTNAGLSGALGLAMSVLSYLFAVQNQYAFFSATAYVGMFMLIIGFVLALGGELLFVRLFFSEPLTPAILTSSILQQGVFCPYCGKPRVTASQSLCSHCGRSLTWTPYAPFCSSCGRLVPANAETCPHCREDIRSKRIYFQLKDETEQVIATKVVAESTKKKSWLAKGLLKTWQTLRTIVQTFLSVTRFFNRLIERLSLTLKEAIFIVVLAYLFGFIAFIVYKRVEIPPITPGQYLFYYYGFPLEWLQVKTMVSPAFVYGVEVEWISLILDVILYFSLSFALVYGVARWRR
jgi:hypothetical protein